MKIIQNVTGEAYQIHTIPLGNYDATLKLSFFGTVELWSADIEYHNKTIKGVKLSLGTLHLRSNNLPFDFVIIDNQLTGLDPYALDDFSSGRYSLVVLDSDNLEARRGYDVEE